MFGKQQNPELEKFAQLIVSGTKALFQERGDLSFSSEPQLERKGIIESDGKMCADGMEKFDNQPTYVSAINFYANKADMERKKALGALIIYVQVDYIARLMKLLQYPPVDDDNDAAMQDSCGALCNIIAGRFKSGIVTAGHIELEMSHFINFRNTAFIGIDFCYSEYEMYCITYDIAGEKQLVMEMSMGIVPKR